MLHLKHGCVFLFKNGLHAPDLGRMGMEAKEC